MDNDNIKFCNGDIMDIHIEYILKNCSYVSMDTETTGLDPIKNSLSIIQIYDGTNFYIIRFIESIKPKNINELLATKTVTKIFHFAPFDLSFILYHLKSSEVSNVVCTKISSKILYGLNKKHSLKHLTKEYLGVDLDKTQKLSNWSQNHLTNEQIDYAVNDVRYLYPLWKKLEAELIEKQLYRYAQECFDFLPTQARLSNRGIECIFSY